MKVSRIGALRRLVLPLLRITARDITIRHPYVRDVRFSLNSFKHKGYWYFGKDREKETMRLFSEIVKPGSHVVEVGGHIGFISIYFMWLAGADGRLTVFEPGSNNLPYIRRNIKAAQTIGTRTSLVEKAVGDRVGEISFFEDPLTGQNNSAVADFEGYKSNADFAFTAASTTKKTVPVTTLDQEFGDSVVDFIKIDVEGFEKSVLLGGQELFERCKPVLMVEIQADETDIFSFFHDRGWLMFSENGANLSSPTQLRDNVFVLHKVAHADLINSLFNSVPPKEKA